MKVKRSRLIQELWILATIVAIILCNLHVYRAQILGSYDYYLPIEWRVEDAIFFASMGMICFVSLPRQLNRPSDLFFFAYGIIAVLGVGTYLQSKFHFSVSELALVFVLMTFPMAVVFLVSRITARQFDSLFVQSLRSARAKRYTLAIVLACTAALIALEWPLSTSFSQLYDIRANTNNRFFNLSAYLSGSLASALVPALAFVAGVFRDVKLALVSISIALLIVLAAGIKGHLAYTGFALFLGIIWAAGGWQRVYKYLFFGVVLFYILILYEGFPSDLAEYVFRRIFIVPGVGVGAHLELLNYEYADQFSILFGLDSDIPVTYLVGNVIYEIENNNANTIGFVHAYGSGGLWRYFVAVAMAGAYFFVLNSVYARTGNPLSLIAGFLFAVIMIEQSVFTAMLSSGMAVLLLIVCLQNVKLITKQRKFDTTTKPDNHRYRSAQ